MKRKNLMMLIAVSLVITLLIGCGTAIKEKTDSQTVTQSEADVPTTETQEIESVDVSEKIATEKESEVTEEITPEQTEEPEATAEPTETAEPEPQYTYADLSQTMYAKQSVNVRSLPSTDGEKLGGLSTAQEVTVTGQCNETSWYRIDYNGNVGYVSNNYLVNEKPVVEVKPPANSSTVSRNISDYRSISSLDELSAGAGWDTDYKGFVANHKNIEKVAYTHNGVTVLLYDYQWDNTIIFYDFSVSSTPWSRYNKSDTDKAIEDGGMVTYTSNWEEYITPISNFQIY